MSKKKKKNTKKSKIPAGKIRCPDCNMIIEEGLVFCNNCGNRLPPWVRFNPDSNSGI